MKMEMKTAWISTFLFLFISVYAVIGFQIKCHHLDEDLVIGNSTSNNIAAKNRLLANGPIHGKISEDGRFITCNKTSKYMICFAIWMRLPNDTIKIRKQSCMIWNGELCQQKTCTQSIYNEHKRLEYCCCKGNLCNTNVHLAVATANNHPKQENYSVGLDDVLNESDPYNGRETPRSGLTSNRLGMILGLLATGIFLLVISIIAFKIFCKRRAMQKPNGAQPLRLRKSKTGRQNGLLHSASNGSCGTASTQLVSQNGIRQRYSQGKLLGDFSRLQLTDLIHRGKYGEVWKSKMPSINNSAEDEEVYCVKTFSRGPQQQYFQNERDIYSIPMNCNHPNILTCLGWDVRPSDGLGMLVLEYCPYGSLQAYLINHEVDWKTFMRLSMGAAAGLAHLHSEFGVPGVTRNLTQVVTWTSGESKCPIVHRDVNSRNMVVRRDGTLMISDMGFAVKLAPGGNRYYNRDNQPENAEESPLQEVGTVRYMAPEVLEGFVNLRECESALKQVDVYALALVLWEIARRCSSLYPSNKALPYTEPYWMEGGAQQNPAVLSDLVVKQKVRPKFPPDWNLNEMPHRLLKDTLEESWDSDQEARLSAACILERLKSLITNYPLLGEEKISGPNQNEETPFLQNSSESEHRIVIENPEDISK